MDFKQIKELIRLVNETEVSEVTIEQEDYRIVVKNKKQIVGQFVAPAPPQAMPVFQAPPSSDAPAAKQQASNTESNNEDQKSQGSDNYITIKSPMIGTFYRSPSPDKPNFVKVGDTIGVGTVLCLVEAMKLFNEIESEVSGTIVKILTDDASPVEYDQPLFLVEPI